MQISNRHLNLHKYIETVEDNLKKKKKKTPTGKTCLCHYSSVALLGLCAMEDRAKISVGNNRESPSASVTETEGIPGRSVLLDMFKEI